MNKMKKGFTLVELAIVLVIVGLLISGILVAQSIISTVKIQRFIREINQYDIAVSNFVTNYGGQIPGDSNFFTPAGNNNLIGGEFLGDTSCGATVCSENLGFWKHLSDSSMIKEKYNNDFSGGTIGNVKPGINMPKSSLGKGSVIFSTYSANDNNQSSPKGFYYQVYGVYQNNYPTGMEWLAVDQKIDNANAITGYVRGYNFPALNTACSAPASYCGMAITIMSTNEQPLNN